MPKTDASAFQPTEIKSSLVTLIIQNMASNQYSKYSEYSRYNEIQLYNFNNEIYPTYAATKIIKIENIRYCDATTNFSEIT